MRRLSKILFEASDIIVGTRAWKTYSNNKDFLRVTGRETYRKYLRNYAAVSSILQSSISIVIPTLVSEKDYIPLAVAVGFKILTHLNSKDEEIATREFRQCIIEDNHRQAEFEYQMNQGEEWKLGTN